MSAYDAMEIFSQLSSDPRLIRAWQREVNRRIRRFAKNVSGSSPFIDKPNKRMFGINASKDGTRLVLRGTPPNAGRMKAFNAPTNEWRITKESYRIFGDSGWRTTHKKQVTSGSAGYPIQDVSYYGTSDRPDCFFGIKKGKTTLAYGRTRAGISLPVYARDSYVDWLLSTHGNEIEDIILESGRDIVSKHLSNG